MKDQINIALRTLCGQAVAEGLCSGISAGVSLAGKKARFNCVYGCGSTRFDHLGQEVNEQTMFDLASLTKPLCTALSTFALIDAGLFTWQSACLSRLDPDLSGEKNEISIEHLLAHSSGLPAYQPYYQGFEPMVGRENIATLLRLILAEPLIHPPGSQSIYSDLGFILLGRLIELYAGQPLYHVFRQAITGPLGLDRHLRFLPLGAVGQGEQECIAATEQCQWRQIIMQGEVHDEHCWLMGGVAGHAGLFGTAGGVLSLCEHLLDCWRGRTRHPSFADGLLRQALEWRDDAGRWGLGFDRPTPGQSSSGRTFSPNSVGHLGFTGTSFWIDPERELIVVLLTNRVHPSRENTKIRQFRPYFHDYLLEKTGLA